jgi:hypothetical protein
VIVFDDQDPPSCRLSLRKQDLEATSWADFDRDQPTVLVHDVFGDTEAEARPSADGLS